MYMRVDLLIANVQILNTSVDYELLKFIGQKMQDTQSKLAFVLFFSRQGNEHSLRNGDGSVWNDWTLDIHPGS